ncbi:MAG: hypothetical protein KME20_13850 [Kaiparowitsia implicata GSE-PSE-MK54-09C]|jgi:uncharacterized paraquat-inducible protein A|nr:hypothetical protein [Kaiparowitsia implicata GSE-PSE-MK54-09C]
MKRQRIKSCDRCQCLADVLYRVQWDASQQWYFVCDRCHLHITDNNAHYIYGGTWKARK